MNLDDRDVYLREQVKLLKLPISKLEQLVGDLYKKRFEEHSIEVVSYHRLASSVLLSRKEDKSSLIFHLKNLVVAIIVIIFIK